MKIRINGGAEEFRLPLNVKAMKYREVTVDVYPLRKHSTARNVPLPEHNPNVSKDLQNYLNSIYGKQMNVWFKIIYHDQTIYPYDNDGNGFVGNFDSEIANLYTNSSYINDSRNIRIFLLDSVKIRAYDSYESTIYYGYTHLEGDMATVWTGLDASDQPTSEIVRETIAHEIGHIFRLIGHPDLGEGPAPLVGTDQTKRLMHSLSLELPGPNLLVKKEWDVIENRLKIKLDEN